MKSGKCFKERMIFMCGKKSHLFPEIFFYDSSKHKKNLKKLINITNEEYSKTKQEKFFK